MGVLYSLWPDPSPNLFTLHHPHRRPLLLAHLLTHFQQRHLDRSSFELATERGFRRIHSPASVLPVEGGVVRLRLLPAGAPPFTPVEQARDFYERSVLGAGERESYSSDRVPGDSKPAAQSTASSRNRPPSRPTADAALEREIAQRGAGRPEKDRVAALSEAGLEAGQLAAQLASSAAKSLFSFATSSIRTLAEMTDGAGGQVVRLSRGPVTIRRLIAEGGFGQVYLASGSGSGADFALKKLNCQSREQLEEANDELAALQRFSSENIIRLVDHAVVKSGGGTVVYLLFPLYPLGTAWDMVANALADISSRWPFPQVVDTYSCHIN